ncbi:MAG: hypothetical protein HGA65_14300 [Oscillochloris sp.]|nr:hypothetical protein [Oscillochloris sp.]
MERSSPLTQRVRRLLGTREMAVRSATMVRPLSSVPGDTSALFESQLAQLSATLAELRASDRRREAELRALRAIVRDADERARSLDLVLAEIDDLLQLSQSLLETPEDQLPATTLFERMRARMGVTNRLDPHQREAISDLVARLSTVREQIHTCLIKP